MVCRPSSDAEIRPVSQGSRDLTQTHWDEVHQLGPLFRYSDTWQLVINTATTIVTFLMVFLIQHTQNRDAEAAQIKLDELIRATKGAHNALLDLEELTEQQQDLFRDKYEAIARQAQQNLMAGESDTDIPELG